MVRPGPTRLSNRLQAMAGLGVILGLYALSAEQMVQIGLVASCIAQSIAMSQDQLEATYGFGDEDDAEADDGADAAPGAGARPADDPAGE